LIVFYNYFIIPQLFVLFLEGSRAGTPHCVRTSFPPIAVEPASRTSRKISQTGKQFHAAHVATPVDVSVNADPTKVSGERIEVVPEYSGNGNSEDISGIKAENVDDVI